MLIDKKYLVFDTNSSCNTVAVNIWDGDKPLEQVFCQLGEGGDKYFVDMSEYIGKDLKVEVVRCESEWGRYPHLNTDRDCSELIKYVSCADSYTDKPYSEKYRPVIHYTTQRGWMNDPNGCLYFDGYYHLYYQHCPGATWAMWDNNHWGHAYSKDLINWTETEPVLRFPHAASGTGFVNRENGKICITTSNLIYESDDGGFHYDFKGVNEGGCGDPKIFFDEEFGRYFSITLRDLSSYTIASSPDLKSWTHECDIEGFRECPEFSKFRIEGTDTYKWVLNGGDGAYQIGEFDGHNFIPDKIDENRLDKYVPLTRPVVDFKNKYNGIYINDRLSDDWEKFSAYAHQNFENAPDGRKIRIAWYAVSYAVKGMPFTQAMTIPTELKLKECGFGVRLCYEPVREIEKYRSNEKKNARKISYENGKAFDCIIECDSDCEIKIRGYIFRYENNRMYITPPDAVPFDIPFVPLNNKIKMRAIFDIMTAEFFLGEGEIFIPLKPCPDKSADKDGMDVELSKDGSITAYEFVRFK